MYMYIYMYIYKYVDVCTPHTYKDTLAHLCSLQMHALGRWHSKTRCSSHLCLEPLPFSAMAISLSAPDGLPQHH